MRLTNKRSGRCGLGLGIEAGIFGGVALGTPQHGFDGMIQIHLSHLDVSLGLHKKSITELREEAGDVFTLTASLIMSTQRTLCYLLAILRSSLFTGTIYTQQFVGGDYFTPTQ